MKTKPEAKQYTRDEFCEAFGVKKNTLTIYISRGKIVESIKRGKTVIDIEQPTNKKYYYNYLSKNGIPLDDAEEEKRYEEIQQLSTEALKKRKLAQEVEKLEIQNAKAKGELIPVDLVIPLFKQFVKRTSSSYHNKTEDAVNMLSHKYRISDKDKGKLRNEFIELTNLAISESVEETLGDVEKIAKDYSDKKGVGQHG